MSTYTETPIIAAITSRNDFDSTGYLEANPDVRLAKVDASTHFAQYGINERRNQFVNIAKIKRLRQVKLSKILFRRTAEPDSIRNGPMNFLSKEIRDSFEIPEFPPVAANDYSAEIIEIIRDNSNKLFLDIGAGLRHTYYSNVVNSEIWKSASTDVICIGEDLPFSDSQFDYVLCLAVLEHTKRPWLATQEMIRVVKPGGIIHIDWPFLQPVHGYPHHFFNATPKGNVSQFIEHCDILSCDVRPWQHPIFCLTWMLTEWRAGLPENEKASFDQIRLGDILASSAEQQLSKPFCASLDRVAQNVIAAGTTLIARKR